MQKTLGYIAIIGIAVFFYSQYRKAQKNKPVIKNK